MNKFYALIAMLFVFACGGPEYVIQPDSEPPPPPSESISSNIDSEYFSFNKDFNDLFESFENKTGDYHGLLGSPGSIAYYDTTVNGEKFYNIQTDDGGRDTTWESVLYYGLLKDNKPLIAKASARLKGTKGFDHSLLRVISNYGKFDDLKGTVGILIDKGASPDARGFYGGATALHELMSVFSEGEGRLEAVSIILEAGADPNASDDKGDTPLSLLLDEFNFSSDKAGIIKLLAGSSLDVSRKDASGEVVFAKLLRMASIEDQGIGEDTLLGIMRSSSLKGIEIDKPGAKGRTYLNMAYFGGFEKVAEELLSMGAKDYGIRIEPGAAMAMNTTILGLGSYDIAMLKRKQCEFILDEYGVKYENLTGYPGVDYPIRLKSKVGGIEYRHTGGNEKFSVMDCRMAVALVAWSPILKMHQIKEIEHMRAYSPGAKIGGGTKASYHSKALALDPAHFLYEDGTLLNVKGDWTERSKTEGPCHALELMDRKEPKEQEMLRKLVCDTGRVDIFSAILTPHYNKAHHDHVHVELNPNLQMFIQ
ncbi:extensin family protein [Nitrospirota bacterium]